MSMYETDFEYEPEWDPSEYEPEAPSPIRGRGRGYNTPTQPRPGGNYTRTPSAATTVSQDQLRQALARVKQDIDRVANGVRSNTNNLNDFAGRTTRNLNRAREEQRREVARLDQAIAGARDLGVLGAILGGGDTSKVLLPLLVISMDQQSQQAAAAGTGGAPAGGMLGSNSTGLVLALAVSGALH